MDKIFRSLLCGWMMLDDMSSKQTLASRIVCSSVWWWCDWRTLTNLHINVYWFQGGSGFAFICSTLVQIQSFIRVFSVHTFLLDCVNVVVDCDDEVQHCLLLCYAMFEEWPWECLGRTKVGWWLTGTRSKYLLIVCYFTHNHDILCRSNTV